MAKQLQRRIRREPKDTPYAYIVARREAMLKTWLARGLRTVEIVKEAQQHPLFEHPLLNSNSRPGKLPPKKVLSRGHIVKLINAVRDDIAKYELDADKEMREGILRLKEAMRGAAAEGDWKGVAAIQKTLNEMTGLRRSDAMNPGGGQPFDADTIHEQLEAMEETMPRSKR